MNWSLSDACNFSCEHCYSRDQEHAALGFEEQCRIIDILVAARVPYANLGGGEPLLVEHLFKIIEYGRSQGVKISITTNGYLVTAVVAAKLKAAGVGKVDVSIDSYDPDVHDNFRNRPGSHLRAVAAVGLLRAAGITVDISTVICKINHNDFRQLVDFAVGLGARKISVHNFKCSGAGMRNRDALDLVPEQWRDFYAQARRLAATEQRIKLSLDDPIISSLESFDNDLQATRGQIKGSTCGKISLAIKADGSIAPCGFMPMVIGNILQDDLLTLWRDSEILEKMRNKSASGKCQGCAHYQDCLGGCTARALAVGGDLNSPDPHCWI